MDKASGEVMIASVIKQMNGAATEEWLLSIFRRHAPSLSATGGAASESASETAAPSLQAAQSVSVVLAKLRVNEDEMNADLQETVTAPVQEGRRAAEPTEKVSAQHNEQLPTTMKKKLGEMLFEQGSKHFYDGHAATSVGYFVTAANLGNSDAQYMLGQCHLQGKGVAKNYEVAIGSLLAAAEQGNVRAQKELGLCYKVGRGVPQNMQLSYQWYDKAEKQGDAEATYMLGSFYFDAAYNCCRKAADQGLTRAITQLGVLHHTIKPDEAKAYELYRKAIEQGETEVVGCISGEPRNIWSVACHVLQKENDMLKQQLQRALKSRNNASSRGIRKRGTRNTNNISTPP